MNTQAVVDLTQSLGWLINQEKSELKLTQVFSFLGYKYLLDSALVKPTREMAQTLGFDPKTQVKTKKWSRRDAFTRGPFSFTSRSTGDILSRWTASFLGQKPLQHT